MFNFNQYTPEELALLAYEIALLLSEGMDAEEIEILSGLLQVVGETIGLISAQRAILKGLREENEFPE